MINRADHFGKDVVRVCYGCVVLVIHTGRLSRLTVKVIGECIYV